MDWAPLHPDDVGVALDEDRLVAAIQDRGPRGFEGRLRVLPGHRFFFEHALDHVPGMHLLEAGRQLALAAARRGLALPPAALRARGFQVRFEGFAEKDRELVATAEIDATGGRALPLRFELAQGARVLARGTGTFAVAEPPPVRAGGPAAPAPAEPRPVGRELVHKAREENVLLDWVARRDGSTFEAGMRLLPEHGYFAPRREGGYPNLYVVEACRQLAEAVSHVFLGVPLDRAFVIEEIGVALDGPAALEAPVRLVTTIRDMERRHGAPRRVTLGFQAVQSGTCVLDGAASLRIVPRDLYARIRRGVA